MTVMATVYSIPRYAQGRSDPIWIKNIVTGSLVAFMLISGVPAVQQFLNRRRTKRSSTSQLRCNELLALRASIVGHGKQHIANMLGLPRALVNGHAATWYYALDNAERVAMAIGFDNDHARTVEFFKSPV